MEMVLHIRDDLYRGAKAEAARQGLTLTRFHEEGLRRRLQKQPLPPQGSHTFPVFGSGTPDLCGWVEFKSISEEDEVDQYRTTLGLESKGPWPHF